MVPGLYQAVFPSLNPFWQAFVPAPAVTAIESSAADSRDGASENVSTSSTTPQGDAAHAMMEFWRDASETAQKFWSGPTSPMAFAPQLAIKAQQTMAEVMAPKPQSASWYRAPLGTQDVASGAVGFMAGPFAGLLPAFTAAAPFWSQVTMAAAPAPFSVSPMPVPSIHTMWADQPWARLWMNALASAASAQSAAPVAQMVAQPPVFQIMPAYQSDSGHAVAQILHTTARVMVAILPLIAMLVAMITTLSQHAPVSIA